jgi:glucose-6-phosphate isomerase
MDRAHDDTTDPTRGEISSKAARLEHSLKLSPGVWLSSGADATHAAAISLWKRDASLWSAERDVQAKIAQRLGWLASPALMAKSIERLTAFAHGVRSDGFTHVVLLGMGGSSLAPEVLRAVLGVGPGWPQFHMLDSTDPAAVRAVATPPDRTLYILASKSGTTIEPNVLAAHFRGQLESSGATWANHFVAVTDEGTELAARARADRFRDLFVNPSDIGGRYSAVSFFGLVPAALMGQDVRAIVEWALALLSAADPARRGAAVNPAVGLGALIGHASLVGRDKLTLVLPPSLDAFGLWIEQLIAESTGKQGHGVVPIAGERLGSPDSYDADRVFVRMTIHGESSRTPNGDIAGDLKASGAPVAEIEVPEPAALGAEFLRWEIATAICGALLRVNPFDEPNVQQAKDVTRTLLARYTATGHIEAPAGETRANGVTLTATESARTQLTGRSIDQLLTLLRPADYFSLLAYLGPDPELLQALQRFRASVRDRCRVATMLGYGPRYLHSTGQLHKGGPNTGVFVVVTATPLEDVSIPREPFSFGTLELAQAVGDFLSLDATGRRAARVHLPHPDPRLIDDIAAAFVNALPPAPRR